VAGVAEGAAADPLLTAAADTLTAAVLLSLADAAVSLGGLDWVSAEECWERDKWSGGGGALAWRLAGGSGSGLAGVGCDLFTAWACPCWDS
jgi:hypothetical protein